MLQKLAHQWLNNPATFWYKAIEDGCKNHVKYTNMWDFYRDFTYNTLVTCSYSQANITDN